MPLNHDEAVLSLLDGPPLDSFSSNELNDEVAALLGDDDPLAVALVIEEARSRASEQAKTVAAIEATLEPCRLESPCAGQYPISGTGRCMECGAQRRNIEAPPEIAAAEAEGTFVAKSDTEAPVAAQSSVEAPPALVIPDSSGMTLTARIKEALGLPDKLMANLLGVARPTAQAYASGRLPELIDGVRAEYMRRAIRKRLVMLQALDAELTAIIGAGG